MIQILPTGEAAEGVRVSVFRVLESRNLGPSTSCVMLCVRHSTNCLCDIGKAGNIYDLPFP